MAKRVGGVARTLAMQMIPGAIKAGYSAGGFLEYLKGQGLGYRRTLFLADWRSILGIKQVEGALRFVRRDHIPGASVVADVNWRFSQDYVYILRVEKAKGFEIPKKPETVAVLSDIPLAIEQIIAKAWNIIYEQSPERAIQAERLVPWSAYHKIQEPDIGFE